QCDLLSRLRCRARRAGGADSRYRRSAMTGLTITETLSRYLAKNAGEKHLPGEAGVWVFILGDMLVFSLFFCIFIYYRALDVELFLTSQAQLNQNYGAVNTLLLLTSSWFVVMALNAVRNDSGRLAGKLLLLA